MIADPQSTTMTSQARHEKVHPAVWYGRMAVQTIRKKLITNDSSSTGSAKKYHRNAGPTRSLASRITQ